MKLACVNMLYWALAAMPIGGSAIAADAAAPPAADTKSACQFADTGIPSLSIATSLAAGLADPGGVRAALGRRGIQLGLNYFGDFLGDVRGGMRRGTAAEGRLELTFDACLEKLVGWQGANLHANFYQIHGTGLSRYYVGNVLPVSLSEGLTSTRLFELFIQQKLLDGKIDIRVGQLAADSEFVASQYVNIFMNASFGWPAITASNLPSGGPAFPLATPGMRVKLQATDAIQLMAGLFNGDPAGPRPANLDPQRRNNHGFGFRTGDKPLLIGEAAYQYKLAETLPGTVKLGAWRHFGDFSDQRLGTDGLSLADPASNGTALRHKGNYGYYGMIDQLLWQKPGADAGTGIGAFLRAFGNPPDRNLISFYMDAGLNFKGLVPGRPNDSFGIAAAYALTSSRARRLDLDTLASNGFGVAREHEAGIELSYVAGIVDGWTVQPTAQYIFHPGMHIANPRDAAGRAIKDALVLGLRTAVNY